MNRTRRAGLKREETRGRPTRDRVHPEVVPDPTRRRRTTATKQRQITSPVTRSRAGNLQPSECKPTCGMVEKILLTPHAFVLWPRICVQGQLVLVQSPLLTQMLPVQSASIQLTTASLNKTKIGNMSRVRPEEPKFAAVKPFMKKNILQILR